MNKSFLITILLISNLLSATTARADYISTVGYKVMTYGLSGFDIPATVGATTEWHDNNSVMFNTLSSNDRSSFFELVVDGSQTGDGVTWKTSNPGIGIQYKAEVTSPLFSPGESTTAPNYRLNLTGGNGTDRTDYYHLRYRLVRLLEKVPSGKITSLPRITLNTYNPTGAGPGMLSGLVLSGIASLPRVGTCAINAPTEIKLAPLYGSSLVNGSQNVSATQSIQLVNCPGAIDNISYVFHAVYGTHNAASGVLKTETGSGYAQGVYIQVQNSDGSAHTVNADINLAGYDGSGDYTIPDFKVAYFIDDVNSVTAGKVKSAIELQLQYN